MKKLLILILLFASLVVNATTYYVSSAGADGNNGTTTSTTWRTIAKVNGFTFAAGDIVSFNRGDVWRETLIVPRTGASGAYMVFNAYGTGANPQILGSNVSSGWTSQGSNRWRSNTTFTNPRSAYSCDIHFINTDGSHTWGIFETSTGSLAAEYQWTWSGNYIYVYAATDPGTRYTSVEIPQRQMSIDVHNREYIDINGFDLSYGTYNGITYDQSQSMLALTGLTIENCKISHMGGNITSSGNENGFGTDLVYTNMIIRNCEIYECGRRGISLDLYGSGFTVQNILIEQNYFHDGYHTTGVDMSVGSGYSASGNNITIRRNKFYDPPTSTFHSQQIFLQNYNYPTTFLSNIYIYSNIFISPTAESINTEYTSSVYVYNNTFYNHNTVRTSDMGHIQPDHGNQSFKIKNNIFYTNKPTDVNYTALELYTPVEQDYTKIDADYNLYYSTVNTIRIIDANGSSWNETQFAAMKSATGWEAHSPTPANPLFTSSTDYHLQAGSPAIATGVNLGLTVDYDGNTWNATPSIGAYEYGAAPAPIKYIIKSAGKIVKSANKVVVATQ